MTDELFTTYGPIFFKATTYRGLDLINEARLKEGLEPFADSGLVSGWKQRAEIAETLERRGYIYKDPITSLLE